MPTYEIKGRVKEVTPDLAPKGPDAQIPGFLYRRLVLDCSFYSSRHARTFENFPSFEFVGDRRLQLDAVRPGDSVTVSFAISGRQYAKDGAEPAYFNALRGVSVAKAEPHPSAPSPSGAPAYYPPGGYPPQPQASYPAPPPPSYPQWGADPQAPTPPTTPF